MAKLTDAIKAEAEQADAVRRERDHDRIVADLKAKLARRDQRLRQVEKDLESAEEISAFREGLGGCKGKKLPAYKPKSPSGNATAVICLNDWHCEETVDPRTINGLNEYNLTIADQRINKVGHNALELLATQRRMSNIKDLVVWLGGDMITGHIHEDLVEVTSLAPLEACRWGQQRIVGLLQHWLAYADVDSITVVTSFGNHGRTTKVPRVATAAKHSYEYWMYWNIADIFATLGEKRITFKIETSPHNLLDIQGKRVRFQHADLVKFNGGIMGLGVPMNKAINEWNKGIHADFDFGGHFHQEARGPNWYLCNCLIGYNPYALAIKAPPSDPAQTFAVFDRDRPRPVLIQEIYCT